MNASIAIEKLGNRRTGPFSLNTLFANFPERTAKKGTTLIKPNHSLGYVFYLVEGMVKTLSYYPEKNKELVNGYSTAGDIMNLEIWNKNHSEGITLKVTSVKAIYKVIPVNEFREMVLQNQGLNQLVLTTLLNKINKNNGKFVGY